MPTVLAHFTAAELPGTAAILLSGVAIGLMARSTVDLVRGVALAAVASLGFIAATADHLSWAAHVAGALPGNGWDWLWLGAGVVAVAIGSRPAGQH